jgi:hypothetical protein
MNSANGKSPVLGFPKGLTRKIAAVLEEYRYAQRRLATLWTSPDVYAARPDVAPDSYAEFLFRTSGVLNHEPSARVRDRRSLSR